VLDAVAAGVGALVLEITAINFHKIDSLQLLIVREIEVVLLLLAFYYSVKTARAMFQGKIGKAAEPQEFNSGSRS
jgi:hypothetical protein